MKKNCVLNQQYNTDDNVFRLQVFHLFGWFWLMNFIIALGQCVLAGAFASWYWAWDKKKDVPAAPLLDSLWRTMRYHTGMCSFINPPPPPSLHIHAHMHADTHIHAVARHYLSNG